MSKESIDLNICQRGLGETKWTARLGVITKENLDKVKDQRTDNTSAQNALPTPFARFFLMEDAFRIVTSAKKDGVEAGLSYRRMVSDCLDVFELLYNWQYHENHRKDESYKLAFRVWGEEDMKRLKNKVGLLGNPLDSYFSDDISKERRLIFLVLINKDKEFLLACSSPKTGWVTPPDLDKSGATEGMLKSAFVGERYNSVLFPQIRRGSTKKGFYFRDCCTFEERSAGFKNYMVKLIDKADTNYFGTLRSYLHGFDGNDDDIKTSFQLPRKSIMLDNGEKLQLYGLPITCNDGLDATNFFADSIIKIPFGIAEENFVTFEREEDSTLGQDHDYLLPLTKEALEALNPAQIHLSIQENLRGDRVTISLQYNGDTYKKSYSTDQRNEEGYLLDLSLTRLNIDLALFPNILSSEEANNTYFKVALVASENNKRLTFDIDKSKCTFFKTSENGMEQIYEADNKSEYGVMPSVIRSRQSDKCDYSTKYYELFNTTFQAILLSLSFDEQMFTGVLLPKFKTAKATDKHFTYAIDFGTTNTYISRRQTGDSTVPEQLTMADAMTSYLHRKADTPQLSLVNKWETMPFAEAGQAFQSEFLPAFIDGKEHHFPIRTAMSQQVQAAESLNLFGNINIAFLYEKAVTNGDNFIRTNIKWDEKDEDDQLFIRELLLIIRADILLNGGNMGRTNVVWFRPLSFKQSKKENYERFWKEECSQILGIPESQVKCYTESEAPYYYYHEKRTFEENRSVVVVDIGGGSTDIVHFSGNKLTVANSIHFGCDVLWSGGFNRMTNDHLANGVFSYCAGKLQFKDDDLKLINDKMCQTGSRYATNDIINFWISNSRETGITQLFRSAFRPLFLYHYVSLIFYIAQMLKSKNLECPTAITFSGNGSRYIDGYLASEPTLKTITLTVLSDVMDNVPDDIQLVMPVERKESTCYGGLYKANETISPTAYSFIGTDDTQYENVEDIKQDYEQGQLKKGIEEWVKQIDTLFLKALDVLVGREQLEDIDKAHIAQLVNSPLSLDTLMRNEVYNQTLYSDSLLFLPVTAKIEKLTHLNEKN